MKNIFDKLSFKCSRLVTRHYSTSFSLTILLLQKNIRNAIYGIYGFVRSADEIVDSFHDYNKEELLAEFTKNYYKAYRDGISLNPVLNAFQHTVKKYKIPDGLIRAFLASMKTDLSKTTYTKEEYEKYIYGSADAVGLMCLRVFVHENPILYDQLKNSAIALGSAFQKVNFLRDMKNDITILHRRYFPDLPLGQMDEDIKRRIIQEIETDFATAYRGVIKLPKNARLGVYVAYVYYRTLLKQLKRASVSKIMKSRLRLTALTKIRLLLGSYITIKLNLV